MNEKTMAAVYFPTMDSTCQSEIVALKVKIGEGEAARVVDRECWDDLAEYVRDRVHRERTLVPIAAVQMDISGVGTEDNGHQETPMYPGFGGSTASGWDILEYSSDIDALK